MKLKKDWNKSVIVLKNNGSVLPKHKQDMVLKQMGLPPYKKKEKIIVVPN